MPKDVSGALDVLIIKDIWQFGLAYMDDIIVFLQTPDDSIDDVRRVLIHLLDLHVMLTSVKCKFFTA